MSDAVQVSLSFTSQTSLQPSGTSTIELFCEDS